MSILGKLFGFEDDERHTPARPETESVRKIVEKLDHMDPERARFVAAFSFVLSRVAGADMKISDAETRAMERIVMEHGGLSEEQAIIVVQMAKHQHMLFGGTENYLVTRELNRIASRQQKIALLECLFVVSAADDTISTVEGNVIRQVADQLRLEQHDYLEAKTKFKEFLGVLKRDTDGKRQA